MRFDGFNPPEPLIPDGKIHRFKMDASDSKESGWYRGYRNVSQSGEDFFVFIYGSWRSSEVLKAISGSSRLDKHDRERVDEQIRKAKLAAERERKELQNRAALQARDKWDSLTDEFGKNEYLEKKGLKKLFGARIDGFKLVVPMRNADGEIRNLERITTLEKKGIFGGERTGLFHQIGEPRDTIYLCEGFSTAASVHDVMGECAVASFNAANLPHVAKALAAKYPQKKIVVCADNDRFPSEKTGEIENVGVEKATEAANICGGTLVVPQFPDDGNRFTDFNDLLLGFGPDEVRKQLSISDDKKEIVSREFVINGVYPDENPRTLARKGTLSNVAELLRRLRVQVRYNVITKDEEIIIPDFSSIEDNRQTATYAYVLDWCERVGIPYTNLKAYLTALANSNPFNPVVQWIESRPWDGVDRLQELFDTVTPAEGYPNDLKEKLIRTWMISAVRAAYSYDGLSCHGILVFQGDQHLGKTHWFKKLVPSDLKLTADGMILNPDSRDSVFAAVRYWMVELGEVDAIFKKSDISRIKAFVTKDRDTMRRSHAVKESSYPRRTVFFGSVNPQDFLKDPTGNRRFWTVPVRHIDHSHKLDMQQVWAQVREIEKSGAPHVLSLEDLDALNHENEGFQEIDPIFERVQVRYGWANKSARFVARTATEVAMDIGINNPAPREVSSVARALRALAGTPRKSHGRLVWDVPLSNAAS